MDRSSWLVDGRRFATKIKSASGTNDPERLEWESNDPSRTCPNCLHLIDNSDVAQKWPGLPRGVKFDPSDQEIILHLLAKAGLGQSKPHPFIDEFIPTVNEDDGICYTHPQKLPGVKQDGSVCHFFHKAIKAYNTGNRKRRKILDGDFGDMRWHKTGRTKPIMLDGLQRGCKKIMVLYMSSVKGGKPEKTNWVMHQYHLGTDEEEKDGEYVVSRIYYQQQQMKIIDDITNQDVHENYGASAAKVDPVTPKLVTPDPPRNERKNVYVDPGKHTVVTSIADLAQHSEDENDEVVNDDEIEEENHGVGDAKWWDIDSQNLLDSQQLVEALSLCDDLLQNQSPSHDGNRRDGVVTKSNSKLSDYAQLGPEQLKNDLEECQNHVLDPANIEIDTPPDFRLSQLEFESQDSFSAWGGGKV